MEENRTTMEKQQEEVKGIKFNVPIRGINIWAAILGIPLAIVLGLFLTAMHIGSGAHEYTDEAYNIIKTAVELCTTEEIGIDEKELREYVDKYYREYTRDDINTMVCQINKGYFKARVTIQLTDSYKILSMTKNYADFEEYIRWFWIRFIIQGVLIGIGIWCVIIIAWKIVLYMFIRASNRQERSENVKDQTEYQEDMKLMEVEECTSQTDEQEMQQVMEM